MVIGPHEVVIADPGRVSLLDMSLYGVGVRIIAWPHMSAYSHVSNPKIRRQVVEGSKV